jgi:hypothetical protein
MSEAPGPGARSVHPTIKKKASHGEERIGMKVALPAALGRRAIPGVIENRQFEKEKRH